MTLEQLLSHEESSTENMEKYFTTVGLTHIKKKDLDMIIEKYGLVILILLGLWLFYIP